MVLEGLLRDMISTCTNARAQSSAGPYTDDILERTLAGGIKVAKMVGKANHL